MGKSLEATSTQATTEDASLFWTTEMSHTFSDVMPRNVKGLAGQLHMIARDSMPIKLDTINEILTNGLDTLHQDKTWLAETLEASLAEAGITFSPRVKELILTRSTKMDDEGQLLLAEHADLLATITKEITPAAVLRTQIEADKDLIVDRVDRAIRPERREIYEKLDQTLEGSINMVCYSHYLQELMRQGFKDGKLSPDHIEMARKLNAAYLRDRSFLGDATQYLYKQGVRVTREELNTWGNLANFRNSLSSPTHSN